MCSTFGRDVFVVGSHSLWVSCRYRTAVPSLFRRVDTRTCTCSDITRNLADQLFEHRSNVRPGISRARGFLHSPTWDNTAACVQISPSAAERGTERSNQTDDNYAGPLGAPGVSSTPPKRGQLRRAVDTRERVNADSRIRRSCARAVSARLGLARPSPQFRLPWSTTRDQVGKGSLSIARKPADQCGFAVIPRRWAVERTIDQITAHRRLAQDYERHPTRPETMIH